MTLSDKNIYLYILGGLVAEPAKLTEYEDINIDDFDVKLCKIIFSAIQSLFRQGYTKLDPLMVEMEIKKHGAYWQYYENNSGTEYLNNCLEFGGGEMLVQFKENYETLKKLSLLRVLQKKKYDISKYYKDDTDFQSSKEETETIERLNNASVDSILNSVEGDLNEIKTKFLNGGRSRKDASAGIAQLVEKLKVSPNIGPDLSGSLFNTAVRGARPGCLYLKSASSGCGKSRTSVFDACKLVYPEYFSKKYNKFIEEHSNFDGELRKSLKVLFIVTEMDAEELQTIILAYLSKVNESHILMNTYDGDEEARVMHAVEIMEKYKDYFIIETISDPNLTNVSATIKRYAMLENIKYCFFDYIHSTPSLLNQFAAARVREDVALMLLSNQLKQLAKDYNLFIFSATQVNADGMTSDAGFKNETCIRGAKSIVDKADCAYIMSRVSEKEQNQLLEKMKEFRGKKDIPDMSEVPNFVLDIYKNRRGQYKNVRIWIKLDLGTGDRRDLFMTSADYEPLNYIETIDQNSEVII